MSLTSVSVMPPQSARGKFSLFVLALCAVGALFGWTGSANAQCSGAGTTTYTSSGGVSVTGGGGSSVVSTKGIPVSGLSGAITCVSVTLNGVTSNGYQQAPNTAWYASMLSAAFMLTSPDGKKLEFLGATGNGTDGDNTASDSGSGLAGLNITVYDGASSAAPLNDVGLWQHTGNVIVKPSSYFSSGNVSEGNPPLGSSSTQWAQTDGSGTFTTAFVNAGATANGSWTLSLQDNSSWTNADPVSITSWTLQITTIATSNYSTTTSLSSNLNPSFTSGTNSSVTLTATVTDTGGGGTPTGTVNFTNNGTTISGCGAKALSGGQATCTTTFASEGIQALGAAYAPGSGFSQSSASTVSQYVKNHSTLSSGLYCNSGAIYSAGSNTSSPYPSIINVGTDTTALTGSVANVNVILKNVNASVGLGPEEGFLLVAPDTSKAYNLDFLSVESNAVSNATITIADNNPSAAGVGTISGSVTYEATDNSNTADPFPAATSPAPQPPSTINFPQPQTFDLNPLTLGEVFNGANGNGDWKLYLYDGNGTATNVSGGWCLAITQNNGAVTTTTLTSSANPVYTGGAVTITATVTSGGSPVTSGFVTFTENGAAPAGVASNAVVVNGSGQASITTSSLSEGDHQITASYSGNSGIYDPSSYIAWQRVDTRTTISGAGTASSPAIVCNQGGITLPGSSNPASDLGEAAPNPSNIFAANLPGTLESVQLELEGFHTGSQVTINNTSSLVVGPNGTGFDFFSGTGSHSNTTTLSTGNYTFSDSASGAAPESAYGPGTYLPSAYDSSDTFFASPSGFYTLPSSFDYAEPHSNAFSFNGNSNGAFTGINPNGTWSLYFNQNIHDTGAGATGWCVKIIDNLPTVTVDLASNPSFTPGQQGAFTVDVTNNGPGSTGDVTGSNPMTVTGTLNSAFTYASASGTGWSCSAAGQNLSCTNDSAIADGSAYPELTINVNVSSGASGNIATTLTASGAGVSSTNSNTDTVTLNSPPAITSGSSATFTVGVAGSFTVTTTGTPAATLSEGGVLPSGVTFIDNGNGTATLSGTPAVGTNGTYAVTITAANGASPNATQSFTLIVNQPPAITSANNTTFTVGSTGSFTVTASGTTPFTFLESGTLPAGVTLSSAGLLSGTPAAGTGGSYPITITASNGVSPNATQSFTLTVNQAPAITSASGTTFTVGSAGSFSAIATGYPAVTISESGALPSGVTFTSSGVLSGTPAAVGSFPITITASNGIGSDATQNFTLTVNAGAATHLVIPGGPEPFYTAFGFNIYAYDALGNLATSYNGTVALSSSDPGFANLGPVTLVNGVGTASAALKTAGVDTITATDIANSSITGTGSFTIQPGAATYLAVSAPSSAYAGAPISFTVTVYDLYGNVATGYSGTLSFSSTDPAAILPGSSTLTNGSGSFSATFNTAGSQTITATDSLNSLSASSGVINVTIPTLVVTTPIDDAGNAANCTAQATPGSGSDSACSLRDALLAAASAGSGAISFDASKFASATTIALTNGTLTLPSNTSVTGPTAGSGASLANLVTVSGGGPSSNFPVVTVASQAVNTLIANLAITNGNDATGTGGGIDNGYQSTLSLVNSTVSGNTSNGVGGIFNDYNATLTVTGSTITGNSGSAGGIGNEPGGTVTVTSSTLGGNSASSGGGGIATGGGTVTVTASTIAGNTAVNGGSGIGIGGGTFILANSIVSGNTPSGSDIGGSYTDNGGNVIGSASFGLAPLASDGGPTKTLLPLPGSTAICAGTSNNVGSLSGDQRGVGFDPNCPAGTVDSGAVQTHYALAFTTEPPANPFFGLPISPAPAVSLTENGNLAAAATNSVALTDSNSLLTGTTTANLTAGTASFNNLILSAVDSSDTLTATLALNSSINLTAQSTSFQAHYSPAQLTSPAPGSMVTTSSVTFQWTKGVGINGYQLCLGDTSAGNCNLYASGIITAQSANVTGIPINGENLFVRIWSRAGTTWVSADFTLTTSGTPVLAALTSPTPGTALNSTSVNFQWTAGGGVTGYILMLGSSKGAHDLYNGAVTSATSATVAGLPSSGGTVYVRLFSRFNGSLNLYNDYTYLLTPPATLSTPTAGAVFTGSSQTFTWTPVAGATGYALWLGSTAGSGNLYVGHATGATLTASGLPINGGTIYARLYTSFNGGSYAYTDTTFTAVSPTVLTSPTPGSAFTGSSATFNWAPASGATAFTLWLGSSVGSGNLYVGHTTGSTLTASGLPINGQTIYARLYTNFNGVTGYTDTTFTAVSPATLINPTPGATLGGSSQTFSWTPLAGATGYALWLGTTAGSGNLLNAHTTATSTTATNLPVNGATIYARLYTNFNGVTGYIDTTFTAK